MSKFVKMMQEELARSRELFPRPTNSLHEGYAVMLEEVDEAWEEIKVNARLRDNGAVLQELVQVAAMAAKMAEDLLL
jgi:predicted HNH restriction endonuclease